MFKLKEKIVVVMLCFLQLGFSQNGFRKRINVSGSSAITSFAAFETKPNNYLILSSNNVSENSYWVDKLIVTLYNEETDSYINKQYGDTSLVYNLNAIPWIRNFGKKIDSSIYLVINGKSVTEQKYYGLLVKINAQGDTVWQKKYKNAGTHLLLLNCNKSTDGGFLLCGSQWDTAQIRSRLLFIKTDAQGKELWRKIYNGPLPNFYEGRDILQDSATKNIIVSGIYYRDTTYMIAERFIHLFDSVGNIKHKFVIPYQYNTNSHNIVKDKFNNYYIYGSKIKYYIGSNPMYKKYIYKFVVAPNNILPIYEKEFGETANGNICSAIKFDSNNNFDAICSIDTNVVNNVMGNAMVNLVKIDSNGFVLKKQYFNYSFNNNWLYGVDPYNANRTSDGGIIAPVKRVLTNNAPIFFVKYNANWCDTTAAYCATVGFKEQNYQTLDVSIYPQPAKQFINLQSTLFANKKAQVYISNAIGQICYNATVQFNNGNTQLNLGNLPKGIYFLKLLDEDLRSFTSKIVLE